MTPSKPYILRALYEWIVDNQCTPYLLVHVDAPGVKVPEGYAENGQMVLNLSPTAVRHFSITNDAVSFEARFSGVAQQLFVPMDAVLAIYARENGQGMFFDGQLLAEEEANRPVDEPDEQPGEPEEPPPEPPRPGGGRPSLRIVK